MKFFGPAIFFPEYISDLPMEYSQYTEEEDNDIEIVWQTELGRIEICFPMKDKNRKFKLYEIYRHKESKESEFEYFPLDELREALINIKANIE